SSFILLFRVLVAKQTHEQGQQRLARQGLPRRRGPAQLAAHEIDQALDLGGAEVPWPGRLVQLAQALAPLRFVAAPGRLPASLVTAVMAQENSLPAARCSAMARCCTVSSSMCRTRTARARRGPGPPCPKARDRRSPSAGPA